MKRWFPLIPFLATACLLGSPPEPPRYFRPEIPPRTATAPPAQGEWGAEASLTPLRINRVRSAAYLSERMVWRASDVEFGFWDSRRWTEHPANYVEQQLARELFERRGLRRAQAGRVPALAVELLAFDDVLEPVHQARVELRALLLDPQNLALLERTYEAAIPVEGNDPVQLSRAMGQALDEVVQRLATDVTAALPARAS